MVCRVCHDVLYGHKGRRSGASQLQLEFEHQATYQNLEDTANTGSCYICSVLRNKLKQAGVDTQPQGPGQSSNKALSATLKGFPNKPGLYRLDFKIQSTGKVLASFVIKEKDASFPETVNSLPISDTTDADQVADMAKNWVHDCDANHIRCRNSSGQELPTRLVHIRMEKGKIRLRLVSSRQTLEEKIPGQPIMQGRYVSLSHCWGGHLPLKTTPSTLTAYLDDIPMDRLPATFRDAIIFAQKLGIEWIWIDALCIIQDQPSKEDWLLEVSKMRQYYRNSFLNISATDARNGSEGLYRKRDNAAAWIGDVTLRTKELKGSRRSNSNNQSEYSSCTILDLDFWQQAVETAPVNLRSWVFQERILAPRVIHFCRDQIAFECREQDLAECRPDGLPIFQMQRNQLVEAARLKSFDVETGKRLRLARLAGQISNLRQMLDESDPLIQRLYLYELWKRLVDVYTKLGLSDQSDRLVALSGIAQEMAAVMKSYGLENKYIAGMWQESIASQLLWRVNEGIGMSRQPFEDNMPKNFKGEPIYRAPSWSWVSVETKRGIYFPEPTDGKPLIQVNVVRLIYKRGEDMYGLVTDGYIIITGVLRKIELTDTRAPKLRPNVSIHTHRREPYSTQKSTKALLEGLQPASFHVTLRLDVELTRNSALTLVTSTFCLLLAITLGVMTWSPIFHTQITMRYFLKYVIALLLLATIAIPSVKFSTIDLPMYPLRRRPAPSSPHTPSLTSIDRSPNRYHWRLVKDGVPSGDIYENVFLDSPASQPSIFGPEGRVYCIPALEDSDNLTCLLVQSTDSGDYGVRYKRVGIAKVSKLYGDLADILDLKTAPGHNEIKQGQYYYMPKLDEQGKKQIESGDPLDRVTGESTICII